MAPQCCRRAVQLFRHVTVEPVIFLYMFASSLTFSAFMAITYDKSCLLLYNETTCRALDNASWARRHGQLQDGVQAEASAWTMRGNITITVPAALSLLLWLGSWGDRAGRRLPLLVPCVGAAAYSVSNIINAAHLDWSPVYMLPGEVVSGLGGSYVAVLMAGYTYLTVLAAADRRMSRVGVAEAAVFLSSTLSVFLSGRLIDTLGFLPVFAIALSCQCLAIVYVIFLLPEIQPRPAGTTCCDVMCSNPVRQMWQFVATPRPTHVKVHLSLFVLVLCILQLCTTGENDVLLLYLKRSPRGWSYTYYGYLKGSENLARGASVLLLLPALKAGPGLRDTSLILLGLCSKAAGLVLLGLATHTWAIFTAAFLACLQGFPSAGLRAQMSGLVEKEEQGRLFGLVAAVECVVTFLSSLLFNGLYPLTLTLYDGLCFQLAAGLVAVCFFVIIVQHFVLKRMDEETGCSSTEYAKEESQHIQAPGVSSVASSVEGTPS